MKASLLQVIDPPPSSGYSSGQIEIFREKFRNIQRKREIFRITQLEQAIETNPTNWQFKFEKQ